MASSNTLKQASAIQSATVTTVLIYRVFLRLMMVLQQTFPEFASLDGASHRVTIPSAKYQFATELVRKQTHGSELQLTLLPGRTLNANTELTILQSVPGK